MITLHVRTDCILGLQFIRNISEDRKASGIHIDYSVFQKWVATLVLWYSPIQIHEPQAFVKDRNRKNRREKSSQLFFVSVAVLTLT